MSLYDEIVRLLIKYDNLEKRLRSQHKVELLSCVKVV